MSDKMTDEQVHAELERIDAEWVNVWDHEHNRDFSNFDGMEPSVDNDGNVEFDEPDDTMIKILRLLAESQQALGEIEQKTKKVIEHPPSGHTISTTLANVCIAVNKIAHTARKGGKSWKRFC